MTNGERSRRQPSALGGEGRTVHATLERVLSEEPARILSVLIRILGDFDLAEDALQDAVATALERWPVDGIPDNPSAWLVTTARRGAIDRLRRSATWRRKAEALRVLQDLGGNVRRIRLLFLPMDDLSRTLVGSHSGVHFLGELQTPSAPLNADVSQPVMKDANAW